MRTEPYSKTPHGHPKPLEDTGGLSSQELVSDVSPDGYEGPPSTWQQARAVMDALTARAGRGATATGKLYVQFGHRGQTFDPQIGILHGLQKGRAFGLYTFKSPGWANRLVNLGMVEREQVAVGGRDFWKIEGPEDLVAYWKTAAPYLAPDLAPLPGETDPILGTTA